MQTNQKSKSSCIAIFVAMPFELKPLLQLFKIDRKWVKDHLPFYETHWKKFRLLFVQTGVGKKNAKKGAKTLLKYERPLFAISTGLCGAVTPHLKLYDSIFSTEMLDLNSKTHFSFSSSFKQEILRKLEEQFDSTGKMITSKGVLSSKEKGELVSQDSQIVGCDMESSGFAEVCKEANLPFSVFRTISDSKEAKIPSAEFLRQRSNGAKIKFLFSSLPIYRWVPELVFLLQFGWRCRQATKKNAKAFLRLLACF